MARLKSLRKKLEDRREWYLIREKLGDTTLAPKIMALDKAIMMLIDNPHIEKVIENYLDEKQFPCQN